MSAVALPVLGRGQVVPTFRPRAVREIATESSPIGTAHAVTAATPDAIDGALFEAVREAVIAGETVVSWQVFESARAFSAALPHNLPHPEVTIEPDGEIAFDWNDDPRRALSVNIGNGELGFSALIGHEAVYGRVPFIRTIPDTVALVLRKIFRA